MQAKQRRNKIKQIKRIAMNSRDPTTMAKVLVETKCELPRKQSELQKLKLKRNNFLQEAMSLITGQKKDKHLNSIQAKRELISKFDSFLPEFDEADIINLDTKPFASGKFESIYWAKISFIGTICGKKVIIGSVTDLKAEALVMQQVSGDECFPFLFGVMKRGELLVEYISGGFTLGKTKPSRTLRSVYGKGQLKAKAWFSLCRELVRGLGFLHSKGISHNDLHT